jgi:hypothetical protein
MSHDRYRHQNEPARPGGWSAQIAIITLAVLVAGLLVPVPGRFRAPWISSLQDLVHVPVFAGVTWALRRVMGGRLILAAAAALAIVVVAELLQTFIGRSASLSDVARGSCGIAIFVGWTVVRRFFTGWQRRAAELACLLIGSALPLAAAWPTLVDAIDAWREFPVLANFSSPWENRRWRANGCQLSCKPQASGEGVGILESDVGGPPSPAIILFPIHRDWSSWRWLHVEFTVEGGAVPITLSVRDGRRVMPPRQRFDHRDTYRRGRQRVQIDLRQIAQGSDQVAPIDIRAVESFHFVIHSDGADCVVRLHRIWLE